MRCFQFKTSAFEVKKKKSLTSWENLKRNLIFVSFIDVDYVSLPPLLGEKILPFLDVLDVFKRIMHLLFWSFI